MSAPRPNVVNLERVHKSYGVRPLLDGVSLGVAAGQRVGVVGRNGDGKTTLLKIIGDLEEPDQGRVSRSRGLHLGYLTQGDDLDPSATVREAVLRGKADHEWAADSSTREVVEVLLVGLSLDRVVSGLSGGERRRCSLARLLLEDHDLIVLDEPTNHLDVEAVSWLAEHLARRTSALVVVTHDRWFLDAVCDTTWEVHDGVVDVYDGGYAAFVLAKAERQRQAAASEARRQNLMRKELAWLRRGAPARTSKPKFRIDAANALIEDEPPPRDRLELQRFASQRLGKDVLDLEDVTLVRGDKMLLDHATWRLGPGDRVGLVGVNGAGKTSVLRLLSGELAPAAGRVKTGRTVALEHLTQALDDLDPDERVLHAVERIKRVTKTAAGEITASSMLERFGFTGDRLTARIGDLSGGERRRFQMLRLLLDEPNVLLLDEPTNDLDIETLNVLEDFLDGWPGTLVVVSHDRYFLERVCDTVWALLGDGTIRMLPRGVDEYLERREAALRSGAGGTGVAAAVGNGGGVAGAGEATGPSNPPSSSVASQPGVSTDGPASSASASGSGAAPPASAGPAASAGEMREAKKAMARIDRQLTKLANREADLHAQLAEHAADYEKLAELDARLRELAAEKESLEEEWLEAASLLE
ncbi:ABC-F family ATP-binding cassette domain-containing protein [Nocardioides sp. WL0053]|uniref:ABC-F family ATP-binding cassette domain-containing protein n=1 Tax=Nocardioides jiangsuensis TaxID=2866161 RepID=A0ABS7RJH1_9ACTN|nr:ABC-F family ATP-binding cassette domain-containing protein [Nocardioides jiangsuensis]MBY9075200.1 ABC-F family ATP-binding cassette domain-containing protein [Nocardioides jiangsuensis]